ncbi:hypothetical protein G7076_02580 [Sphingomonas sp. HDW15A]|uniref:hypothetical protein n=1 Tax=Sphingomonas sp. HDW15A TaxID=2714942 RepID=UPI00140DA35E|nr:hypothetical protein [Sphingomonas sp. HDW15A]QIK95079.1 hypothetical protein G7076_02580 [Sphingomonas sp. HDW15A]
MDRIVAIGLLTDDDLSRLGDAFTRLWPVENSSGFEDLLAAIDAAQAKSDDAKCVPPEVDTP